MVNPFGSLLLPALVVNQDMCTNQYCGESTILYSKCPARELGVLWTPVFLVRWFAPSLFNYLAPYAESVESIRIMQTDLEQGVPLDPIDLACAKLDIASVVLVLLAIKLAFVATAASIGPALQSVITTAGSAAISVPFLLITVPQLMAQQTYRLRGWRRSH